jgi:type VI protein secretion system component Hcp
MRVSSWACLGTASLLSVFLLMPGAHAIVGGVILVPALENGVPSEKKVDRIPLSSYSWQGAMRDELGADSGVRTLERVAPKDGRPGGLIIAKLVSVAAPSLAAYCKQKARLKEITIDAPLWDQRAADMKEAHGTFKLKEVTVEGCGHNPGAAAETFHLKFAAIERIADTTQ